MKRKCKKKHIAVDAPRGELFARSLGFVLHSPFGLTDNYFFVRPHRISNQDVRMCVYIHMTFVGHFSEE